MRLSRVGTPTLLDKFLGTFETYWNSDSFGRYDPAADRDKLDDALADARGESAGSAAISLSGLELRPYPPSRRYSSRWNPNGRITTGTGIL